MVATDDCVQASLGPIMSDFLVRYICTPSFPKPTREVRGARWYVQRHVAPMASARRWCAGRGFCALNVNNTGARKCNGELITSVIPAFIGIHCSLGGRSWTVVGVWKRLEHKRIAAVTKSRRPVDDVQVSSLPHVLRQGRGMYERKGVGKEGSTSIRLHHESCTTSATILLLLQRQKLEMWHHCTNPCGFTAQYRARPGNPIKSTNSVQMAPSNSCHVKHQRIRLFISELRQQEHVKFIMLPTEHSRFGQEPSIPVLSVSWLK